MRMYEVSKMFEIRLDNAGNIITQGFLMAKELNIHFSSVFTREDTSSIPVPETKFKGSEGERLGQLVVTPKVVVSKINNMKENKSPGVDGISPKILKETVEQISTPLLLGAYPRQDVAAQMSLRNCCRSSATLLAAVIVPNVSVYATNTRI